MSGFMITPPKPCLKFQSGQLTYSHAVLERLRDYFAKRLRISPKFCFNEHQAPIVGHKQVINVAFAASNINRYLAAQREQAGDAWEKIANRQYAWLFVDQCLEEAFRVAPAAMLHSNSG